jgi:hypothetical protein
MGKILSLSDFVRQSNDGRTFQAELENEIGTFAIKDQNGRPKAFCISKNDILDAAESADGISFKQKRFFGIFLKGITNPKSFSINDTLVKREYAITKEALDFIFSNENIKSLKIFLFNSETIIIELSKDNCGGGSGSEGVKVKL